MRMRATRILDKSPEICESIGSRTNMAYWVALSFEFTDSLELLPYGRLSGSYRLDTRRERQASSPYQNGYGARIHGMLQ